MKICSHCGFKLLDNQRYCPKCGLPITTSNNQDKSNLSHDENIENTARIEIPNFDEKEHNKKYEDLKLIVVHMGGGVSVGAHLNGRIVDVNNALDGEGAFSPERAGGVPSGDLVKLCFSGKYTQQEVTKKLVGNGGFNAYIGSNDARDLEKLVNEGDEHAKLVQDAFYQQVAKDIGAMATVLCGQVDQIILTGGIAYSKHTCAELEKRAGFIAPFTVYPGEDELLALAQGALRVMNGEEAPMSY